MEELRQTPLAHATHQAVVRVILVAREVVFVHHLNTWVFSVLKALRRAGRQAGFEHRFPASSSKLCQI